MQGMKRGTKKEIKVSKGLSTCQTHHLHEEVISMVSKGMPSGEQMAKMSELLKIFGDSTRMTILCALSKAELCVCDLCEVVKMSKSAVSHQLRALRENNLVKFRREGKAVFYSLADNHVHEILNIALEHVLE